MPKECPEDKILNSATNRCVSKTGAIGKKLLKNNVSVPAPVPVPIPAPRRSMGMTKEEPIIKDTRPAPSPRRLTSRRPSSLSIPIYQPPSSYIVPGSSSSTTMATASLPSASSYASLPSASSYASVALTPRGDDIFYDAPEYSAQMSNAARIIQKAVKKNLPRFYDAPDIIEEEEKYYTAPQYTKKELKEMKKKKKMTNEFISNINKIQSTPEYMMGLFDKPTSLPGSQFDILEDVAYINRAIRETNKPKPKVKKTNKRSNPIYEFDENKPKIKKTNKKK
jgi:hypothetical protein